MSDASPDPIPHAHRPDAPAPEDHHRSLTGGEARAAVFGVSDGLVSNVSLILGVAAGSGADPAAVQLAGIAGLFAGACSMAAGEYVSMRAQVELFEREVELERSEIAKHPKEEQAELALIYQAKGIPQEQAEELAATVHKDPALALDTHVREELGVNPEELGNPMGAAVASFVAFSIGALVPLLPWFFDDGASATWTSVALGAVASLAVGARLGVTTGRPIGKPALRQLAVGVLAAGATYLIGTLFNVSV